MTVMSHIYILYKVTGYVERPDYKHFNEYSKEKKYGTKYNVENHRKVLQTWKEDLRDKKYNNDRKHQNISIDKLSALEAIEEYVVLHLHEAFFEQLHYIKYGSHRRNGSVETVKQLVEQVNKKSKRFGKNSTNKTEHAPEQILFLHHVTNYLGIKYGVWNIEQSIKRTNKNIFFDPESDPSNYDMQHYCSPIADVDLEQLYSALKTIDAAIIPQEIANDFGNEELFKQLQALNKKCKQKVRLVKNSVFELSDENDIDINDDTDDNKDDEKKKDMDTDNDIDSSYETESETNVFDGTVLKTHNSRKRKQLKNVEDDVINITESDDDDDVDEEIDVNML
eukprot:94285_1